MVANMNHVAVNLSGLRVPDRDFQDNVMQTGFNFKQVFFLPDPVVPVPIAKGHADGMRQIDCLAVSRSTGIDLQYGIEKLDDIFRIHIERCRDAGQAEPGQIRFFGVSRCDVRVNPVAARLLDQCFKFTL